MKRLVIFTLALCLALPDARAQVVNTDTISYRAKAGDTLGMIAAEHYGDRRRAIFIMVENKITHARPLRPGERLRIPVNREITTSPGDTFETLAGTFLGNPLRGRFLAEFNRMSPDERLPAGAQLQVPFTVTHTAASTESLASIGAAYFNDSKQGDMLKRYNFLEKGSIEKGESIIVPVYNVQLQAAKMPQVDAEAKTRRVARRDAASKATSALPKAWQAWRSGDYRRIEMLLHGIDVDYLDTAEAVDVGLLRGLAQAAEGKTELALESFKEVRARAEAHVLHKFDYSPKILALWEQAGGQSQ